jgi:hypothetical protein
MLSTPIITRTESGAVWVAEIGNISVVMPWVLATHQFLAVLEPVFLALLEILVAVWAPAAVVAITIYAAHMSAHL